MKGSCRKDWALCIWSPPRAGYKSLQSIHDANLRGPEASGDLQHFRQIILKAPDLGRLLGNSNMALLF